MAQEEKTSVILFKEKKFILFSIVLSIVLAVTVTFFIPKKYSSFAIIYPAKTNSLNEIAKNPDFGFEIHADRLIQLIESQIIQDSLVNKFNLLEYYELNESQSDWRFKLNEFMARDININRTRFLSIVITVTTEDPELSANMANYIIETVDVVKENILKENTKIAVNVYKKQFEDQRHHVDSLLNLIFKLTDSESSIAEKNNILFEKRNNTIKERQKESIFTSADDAIMNISPENQNQQTERIINSYFHERGVLFDIRKKYEDANEQLISPIPKSYIISEAKPDNRKVSPSLSTNILIALGIGILSAILFILIKHKVKAIKEEMA